MLSSLPRRLVTSRSGPPALRLLSTPASSADTEATIVAKLTERFSPSELAVQDVSGGCGSFFAIKIASDAFKGLSTVEQHKLITNILKQEVRGIHGLQIKTIIPP